MTKRAQDAYVRGFRKVAMAHGSDPDELMKVAVSLNQLLRGAKALYNMRAGNALLTGAGILGTGTLLKDLYNKKMGKNVNINTHTMQ